MSAYDPSAFVANFDSTNNVRLPFKGEVDLTVDWGDGTVEHVTVDRSSHTYPHEGRWTVSVVGRAKAMSNCHRSVVEVAQWGRLGLKSTRLAFRRCRTLAAVPNNTEGLEHVTDMGGMFWAATSFNRPLDRWDVSAVTDMDHMFHGAVAFDQPLDRWDVSAVTNMGSMFGGAVRFFQDLSGWDVRPDVRAEAMFVGTAMAGQMLPAVLQGRLNSEAGYVEDVDGLPDPVP